ncbi:MAG: hypothetical protein WCK98_00280 [bacterium]
MADISNMFKAFDLRGTCPELNSDIYYWAGFGLVQEVLKPENLSLQINLVHDTRYSSPEFFEAVYNGILAAGGNPRVLGLGSSDFMYAAAQYFKTPGAIVTASHNPKDDNGLKIVKKDAEMVGLESGLDKVRDFVLSKIETQITDRDNWKKPVVDEAAKNEVKQFFIEKIKEIGQVDKINQVLATTNNKLKIVVDAGNGMGGWVMNELLKDLYPNIEFIDLYWELDGNFPNHPANPQDFKNLKDIQELIKSDPEINFGFAFDGDADRVFFVDDKAEVIQGDFLVAFFAKTLLKEYFNKPNPEYQPAIVYIQPGSRCVSEAIGEADGIAIPSKQGHTFIKEQMTNFRAIYGGEFSGHHYFGNFGNMDSGVLAAVLMIKILIQEDKKLSQVFEKLKKTYFISDLQAVRLKPGQTFEDVKAKLLTHFNTGTVSEMDGISVFYPDWKFSIRSSQTEPVLRMIVESRITNTVDAKLAEVLNTINA